MQAWDQSVFNEEIFFLSHDDYKSPNISVRILNYYKVSCQVISSSLTMSSSWLELRHALAALTHAICMRLSAERKSAGLCAVHELESAVQGGSAHGQVEAAAPRQRAHQL